MDAFKGDNDPHLHFEDYNGNFSDSLTVENLHGFVHRNVSEALRKHLGLDFLHRNKFFSPKTAEMHSIGVKDPLE